MLGFCHNFRVLRMPASRLSLVLLSCALVLAAGSVRAEQRAEGVAIEGIRVGFEGRTRVGVWCPVYVTLRNAGSPVAGVLTATTPDAESGPCTFARPEGKLILAAQAAAIVPIYVRFGRLSGTLACTFQPDEGPAVSRTFSTVAGDYERALRSSQRLYVTLGTKVGLEEPAPASDEDDPERPVSVTVTDPARLPDRWYGYDGVSVVVLPTGVAEGGPDFLSRVTAAQWTALDQWVRLGGKLILSLGSRGAQLTADLPDAASQALRGFLPGRVAGVFQQRSASGLETFVASRTQLDTATFKSFTMVQFAEVSGRTDAYERFDAASRPLVVRRAHGLGIVTLLATDLDRGPIAAWPDRPLLLARLLEITAGEHEEEERERSGQLTHIGFSDLAGQLRAALDDFPGVWTPPFLALAAILVGYLLLIGPGDYFFLRRFLEQMHWTWITFPALVLLTCLLAYSLLGGLKSGELAVNQLEIVDLDAAGPSGSPALVRGTAWAHIYSPRTEVFDLSLAPPQVPGRLLAWQGLPGTAFGGMDRPTEPAPWPRDYRIIPEPGPDEPLIAGLPIQTGSTRAVMARWWEQRGLVLSARLTDSGSGPPQGEVENPLDLPLADCRLLFDRWMSRSLGTLQAREKRRIEGVTFDDLAYRLTRRKVQESKEVRVGWSEESRDLERIAELLMFHEAAGGQVYTKLIQRSDPTIDLTPTLRAGRAILLGRGESPAAVLTTGGKPLAPDATRRATWYRIILPVHTAPGTN